MISLLICLLGVSPPPPPYAYVDEARDKWLPYPQSTFTIPDDFSKTWQRPLLSTSPAGQAKVFRRIVQGLYTFSRLFVQDVFHDGHPVETSLYQIEIGIRSRAPSPQCTLYKLFISINLSMGEAFICNTQKRRLREERYRWTSSYFLFALIGAKLVL